MSSSRLSSLVVILFASACGTEMPAADGSVDAPSGACEGLDDGDECATDMICVGGSCVAARCGDGLVSGTESCDDGNEAAFDGCNPDCTLTCDSDADCEDGNPCNGPAVCEETNVCAPNVLSPPGAPCMMAAGGDGVCSADTIPSCIAPGCDNGVTDGTEQCDDGANGDDDDGCTDACEFSCESDDDCTDSNVCTGIESCDATTHACTTTGMLTCTPSDACHMATCDAAQGCLEALIDVDGDGYAPLGLGACGRDCDDNNATVFVGAEEACDGRDNNCDGMTDEVQPFWYIDCDGDDYAQTTDGAVRQCSEPTNPGCPSGGWTSTRPVAGDLTTIDCNDALAARNPDATEIIGNGIDEDCDERELCYVDGDFDGARRSDGSTVDSPDIACTMGAGEAGASAAIDCNDGNPAIRPGATEIPGDAVDQNCDGGEACYVNADGDAYRTLSMVASSDSDCADSGEALGTVTSGDCCDSDSRVFPGNATYYTSVTNCGGYDYNCDNVPTQRYTTIGGCVTSACSNRAGYCGTAPACGGTNEWIDMWGCARVYEPEFMEWTCEWGTDCGVGSGTPRAQQCR